jgi:CsoR family transcriptional regulator, copper-sensing transcriptional repressor
MKCPMRDEVKRSATARLNRIEGQVRGIARMIADDRYCIDVLNQIEAVKAALKKVQDGILRDHIETCVEHAIDSGDPKDQRRKVAELVQVLGHITS